MCHKIVPLDLMESFLYNLFLELCFFIKRTGFSFSKVDIEVHVKLYISQRKKEKEKA
jgi:hypothetical protein